MKRGNTIIISLILIFSLVPSIGGFDNNKENFDPTTKEPIAYTTENINNGRLKGGHDTLTSEGMLLKEKVHQQMDADGGADFRNRMVRDALPNLRTGAHDEDTSKLFNSYLNDPPIGLNGWGDFFQHFYNPDTQDGLKGAFNSAPNRAVNYFSEILKKIGCGPDAISNVSENDKEKIYDYFGRILHLLQDMGNPAHTRDDVHVFTKTYEDYVRNNWSDIVNSDAFKNGATPEEYLKGYYGNLPDIYYPVFFPEEFMKSLANISKNYYTDGLGTITNDQLQANVGKLTPETIKYTAGYINAIYQMMSGGIPGLQGLNCNRPPDPPSPANDHPDDRFDVSDEFYWEKEFGLTDEDLTKLFLRTAIKKGKIGVWYKKRFTEVFIEGRTKYRDASPEIKGAIEAEFREIGKKLDQRKNQVQSDWKGAPDVALFANGFYNPSISLMLRIGEPVSFQRIDFDPAIMRDHPVMLVPTGGFYGLKNSTTVKALLEEYVKNGGTLVLFTQQHGYDWDLLPAPINPETGERTSVTGYGYQEDQSCQFNSVYIDTYHPMLSVFSTSTANIGVDGYFSSYPDNTTILLRRVSNGQPAMIMYPYGNGFVVASTMYTDFAFTHNQTNQTEMNFIQNIISWAKKPESIIEVRPGQAVNLDIDVSNFTDINAASIKLTILDPSRKIVSEQTQSITVAAGQSATTPATYTTAPSSTLGIYHIDYILYDSSGTIIQPQAETDSGRFVVSNPPSSEYQPVDLSYSVNTPREEFLLGQPVPFTVTIWNNSNADKKLRMYWDLSHLQASYLGEVTVAAHGTLSGTYTVNLPRYSTAVRLWVHFFEEKGTPVIMPSYVGHGETWPYVGSCSKGMNIIYPSISATITMDKDSYAKGETPVINTSFRNGISASYQTNAKITIMDPKNAVVFEDTRAIDLSAGGTTSFTSNFGLSSSSLMGTYIVTAEASSQNDLGFFSLASTRFELPQSHISVQPNLPSVFDQGTNTIAFTIMNTGKINVSSGTLDSILKAPDGSIVCSGSQPFSIAVGESKTLDIPISIPSLNLGSYVLTYSQSDETRAGKLTSITIPNSIKIDNLSIDKPSCKIRDTVNLSLDIANTGKFNWENISLTVSAPDVNFTDTKTVSLAATSNTTSFNYSIPIPETISAGWHDVNVVITIPGGGPVSKNTGVFVPESSLSIKYQGTATLSAGDTLEVAVENTGGLDTNYNSNIYLLDKGGWWIDSKSVSGSIQAAGQTSLSYTLPGQLTEGPYQIGVDATDVKTSKTTSYYSPPLNITGLKGGLSVKTDKDIYFSNEETTILSTIVNQGKAMVDGNLHLEIVCAESAVSPSPPDGLQSFHIYTMDSPEQWTEHGVLHFPPYYYRQELPLPISPDQGGENASMIIQHEGAQLAFIDYVALKDGNGNLYVPYLVSVNEHDITAEAQAQDGISAEVTGGYVFAYWNNLSSGISYNLVMTAWEASSCGIVWETDTAMNQGSGITQDLNISAGILGQAGKFYLRGELTNSLGQSLGTSYYPFYIIDGDTALSFNTDKRIHRPGETVTITGKIENRAPITAEDLIFSLISSQGGQSPQVISTETLNLPSGGVYPFSITTTAGSDEGAVTLLGNVKQNNQTLISITDQYEIAKPYASAYVYMPEITGNEPFTIEVDLYNDGKVDATVQFGIQSLEFGDSQTVTIPPGEMKILYYSQQISKNVTYTFTFGGDYEETLTQTVSYGLGASVQFGTEIPKVLPEGSVSVPVILTNTGQLAESLEVVYQLTNQNSQPTRVTKTYYLTKGSNITYTLHFNLIEGDYQITASSQKPDASAQAGFSVRKENQAQMAVSLGTQTDGWLPVNINLTNLGFNEISGSVNVSVSPSTGSVQTVWNGEEPLSQLSPQSSQLITLNINPSAIEPGNYNLQVQLLNNSNQLIAVRSLEFGAQGATFQMTQLPPYQIFMAGQEATFVFRVRNIGDQEGSFDLRFKAYDLIDSTQKEWLKPGEEKPISFSFLLPEDLEEKDYFADYELKASVVAGLSKGQVKYHLAGISLNVNASLHKPYYNEGEIAHLTINIQSPNSSPQNLFARVNYAGYEPQQTFTLNGNQVLIFDVPLPKITGEKLFYGIYHEGGRSIHLNSLYIHKAGDVITITTDKQVYNPGETVAVSVSGNASGNMTLSGPGGYTETFIFTGLATKSFTLPATVAAGTYFINAQLSILNSELVTAVYPFDVAGIQMKVLECNNDKGKYASSDTITTSLTISSNTTMPAILKAWIVDPTGQYTTVGEQSISLSSSENSLATQLSPLSTSVSGIHRLVYGIYGPENLLLCSGSEAFDVGDAVLMGISTDKRDYPTNTEPVTVAASLYGSVSADLQLELDGSVVKTESVSLNGFTPYATQLQNIIPGPHTLKGTLTAGGLKSTKEASFTYALAFMPKPQISASPAYIDFGSISLGNTSTQTITLSSTGNVDLVIGTIALSGTNQGKFSIQNDNCSGRTVAPSGNCALDIFFSPTSLGAKSASLSIPSNATDTPTLFLSLGGAGATTLNVSINPSGSGKVTGTGIDCPGDCTESFSTSGASIQLAVTPAEGYRFVNWTGNISQVENPVTVNMGTDENVTANFAINTYAITSTAGLGGVISPSGSVTVNYGGSQAFTITPNIIYHVADVKIDGVSVGAVLAYTFSNMTSDHAIEVIFAINQYTITATSGSNGAISPLGTLIVNYGGRQTFTITPNDGYHVADVKVDGGSVCAVTTFTFDNVTSNHTIEVTFEIDNSVPVADAGLDQNVVTGQAATLNGSKSFDPEGAMITFLWTFVEVPAGSNVTNASLSDLTSAKPQFTPDVNGTYRLQLIVNDGALNSVLDEVILNATTPNVPPNANAGPDQNVFTGTAVQLDGSRSSDPDNGPLPLSYLWSFATKPAGSLLTDSHIANRNMPNASFVPDVDGLYELTLTVNDGNLSSEDTVRIMATTPNVPPNANAGADMTVHLGDTAVLDGSASNDPDHGPQPLTYLWSFVAVPTGSQLTNGAISGANTVSPSFTPDVVGTYVLQLMVFDGKDAGFDNVAVTAGMKQLATLGPVKVWLGLKNSDDQGTYFDLKVELLKNGVTIAIGETRDIRGITRNPSLAKEATVTFGAISDNQLTFGDVLSVRVMTKVTASGGHSNAVGLRLYYDSTSRPSRFGIEIAPDPLKDYFLHSDSSGDFLNSISPTATDPKYKDSASIDRTTYKEIGTWRFTVQ